MTNKIKKSPISALGLIIWGIAALFFLYEFFLRTFIGSVAHQVIPALHLNAVQFAAIGSAYYVTYGAMQIPVGILTDKFGVKKVMLFATLICSASCFLFAASTGFKLAFFSRMLMGFSSSFAFICLLVIAATWFPMRFFGFFAGLSQFIGTMGPLLAGGPLVSMMKSRDESWNTVMTQVGVFGLFIMLLVLFVVRNKPRDGEQALIYLQHPLPLSMRLFRLFKNKQAWLVAAYSACIYISIELLGAIWGTEYLQSRGFTQEIAADIISVCWLGYAIGCPMLGALSDIARRRKPVLVFSGIIGLIATGCITYLPTQHYLIYSILFFLLGIAAAGQNVGFVTISEHVDTTLRATALGFNNGAITLTSALTPPLISYFIMISSHGSTILTPSNFITGFTVMPILYLLSLLISIYFIKETYGKPQKEMIKLNIQAND